MTRNWLVYLIVKLWYALVCFIWKISLIFGRIWHLILQASIMSKHLTKSEKPRYFHIVTDLPCSQKIGKRETGGNNFISLHNVKSPLIAKLWIFYLMCLYECRRLSGHMSSERDLLISSPTEVSIVKFSFCLSCWDYGFTIAIDSSLYIRGF